MIDVEGRQELKELLTADQLRAYEKSLKDLAEDNLSLEKMDFGNVNKIDSSLILENLITLQGVLYLTNSKLKNKM